MKARFSVQQQAPIGSGVPLIAGAILSTGISLLLWGVLSWMGLVLFS